MNMIIVHTSASLKTPAQSVTPSYPIVCFLPVKGWKQWALLSFPAAAAGLPRWNSVSSCKILRILSAFPVPLERIAKSLATAAEVRND